MAGVPKNPEDTPRTPHTPADTADTGEFQMLMAMANRYASAPSAEAKAAIVAENPVLVKTGIQGARALERSALPLVTAVLHRAEETTVGSLGIGLALMGGAITIGTLAYKAGKIAYTWLRGP